MLSKIWIINIALAALIAVSWFGIWSSRQSGAPPVPGVSDVSDADATAEKPKVSEKKAPDPSEYDAIVEKNLFSPDRMANNITIESQPVAEELKISGEKVMLYGVVIVDDYKAALINNPSREANAKEYRWVREGETIDNLKVVAIQTRHILLNDDTTQYKILLYDPKKSHKKEAASRTASAPAEVKAGHQASPENVIVGSETAVKKQAAEQPKPASDTPGSGKNVKTSEDSDYEMIDTPFGMIKKKISK